MILILAAAPLETIILRKKIVDTQVFHCGSVQVFSGELQGQKILLSHGGIGAATMAMQLTRLLSEHAPRAVFLCGCGGSYPESGLEVGSLALATEEVFGDLGVATTERFIPLDQLELQHKPHLVPAIHSSFLLDSELHCWAQKILSKAISGLFVTVNCCSGNSDLSNQLQQRTGGICENMEGAAAAQVCAEFNLPLLELRGISNRTGTHDLRLWDIPLSVKVAQLAIMKLLENWPPSKQEVSCDS